MVRLRLVRLTAVLSAALFAFSVSCANAQLYSISDVQPDGIDSSAAKEVEAALTWRHIDHSGKFARNIRVHVFTTERKSDDADDFGENNFTKDILDQTGTKVIAPHATEVKVYPFSEGLAAFRMRLSLIEQYYPENIPDRYRDKAGTGIISNTNLRRIISASVATLTSLGESLFHPSMNMRTNFKRA